MPTATPNAGRSIAGVRNPARCRNVLRAVLAATTLLAAPALAVTVDWVQVGNPGNAADITGYGRVTYQYRIQKYEWTNSQYVEFLNAVDPQGTNPDGIYSTSMGSDSRGGITFTSTATAGTKYTSKTNMATKPVDFVTWFEGARVANWLHAGALTYATSASGSTAINNGAYTLAGATSGTSPTKNANALYWMPTEDEWFKAAYYKGSGTNAGYWTYATQSDTIPAGVSATTVGTGSSGGVTPVITGNYANFADSAMWNSIFNVTTVGSNGGPSAYGAFDMGGNIGEWNSLSGSASTSQGQRGGAYRFNDYDISKDSRNAGYEAGKSSDLGFRLASYVPAQNITWNTASGTWNSIAANWTTGTGGSFSFISGDTTTFSGTAGGTVTFSGTVAPAAVTISATSGTYAFSTGIGNQLTGTTGLTKSGGGTLVLAGPNTYSGTTTLSAGTLQAQSYGSFGTGSLVLNGGTLGSDGSNARTYPNPVTIGGDVTIGGGTGSGSITFDAAVGLGGSTRILTVAADVTFSSAVSNGSLTKSGAGTLTLSASNSLTGTTTLAAGKLSLGNAGALGTSGAISFTGGVLQFTVSNTTDYSSRFSTAAGQAYALDTNGQNVTLASSLTSSNASLTKSGAGTLTLSASNSLTGTTTIAAGTLAIGNGGTTGSVAGNIANNAALTFNRSDAITYSGTISGTGSLVKQGAGSLTLSASNTFTGATTIAAGKLIVNGVLASSTTTVAAGAVLGGSGTISGAVIVGHSGTLSPGTSPGLLTVNSLLLSGSAVTRMEIVGSGSTAGAAGTAYDQVAVTSANALTFAGTLELDFGNRASLFPQGTTFQLFAFSGTAAGDFTTIRTVDTSGSYAGLTFTPSPYVTGEWTTGIIPGSASQYLVFSENTGRVVALPEPSAIAMAALGTGLAAWHAARRHRRRPAA